MAGRLAERCATRSLAPTPEASAGGWEQGLGRGAAAPVPQSHQGLRHSYITHIRLHNLLLPLPRMGALGADSSVGRDHEPRPYENRVITSTRAPALANGLPSGAGGLPAHPQVQGKQKDPVRTRARCQGRVQREVTACKGEAGICCPNIQVGTGPQTPKSQASFSALKDSPDGKQGAGPLRGRAAWNLRSECELAYPGH